MSPAPFEWADHNVLMVTLDCCRFDTFCYAHTPNMDRVGHVRKADTFGPYTLPAHMSFFAGYLPNVVEPPLEDFYSREKFQLWRLARGKQKSSDTYGLLLEGQTILEGFRRRGHYTLGLGGTRWFTSPLLTSHFDEFKFWGPDDYSNFFQLRSKQDFCLEHLDEIEDTLKDKDKWFLFANCIETHVPYNTGASDLPDEALDLMERAAPIWAGKSMRSIEANVDNDELRLLHQAQIRACEAIDQRLGALFEMLPKPFVVYIAGDHGECFGEDRKWGHGFVHEKVMQVPVVIGVVEE